MVKQSHTLCVLRLILASSGACYDVIDISESLSSIFFLFVGNFDPPW